MIDTILVPMDSSVHARKAATFAIDLAHKYGARLVFLFVFRPDEMTREMQRLANSEHLGAKRPGTLEELMAAVPDEKFPAPLRHEVHPLPTGDFLNVVGKYVFGEAEQEARDKGVAKIDAVVEYGDPAKGIVDVAEREHADLIVMGRRGLSDFEGLVMGSVAHKVSHFADCPCLTIK